MSGSSHRQQFFDHVPSPGSRNGPRLFVSSERRSAAWGPLPRDWRQPFEEAGRDGGDTWNATSPGGLRGEAGAGAPDDG